MIPYGRQDINQADIDAVVEVLSSDFLTQGPKVPQFEHSVATFTGAEHAVAVNSATSALHLACLALGVATGDIVWTSAITFVASANCALYCGAEVDFVDIDPRTYNLSVAALEAKLIEAERKGKLPKVVIPVHLCGQPCEMKAIHALAQQYDFSIIEDASHAIGARYLNEPVGNCAYSDITVFSFHPVKIVTTGEGGLATTNNADLAQSMDSQRSHGITRDPEKMANEPHGPWYYEQLDLGYNYRMTELQAALGVSQMQRLEEFVHKRQMLAHRYDTQLAGLPLTLPWQHPDTSSSRHLYVIRTQGGSKKRTHLGVYQALRERGIGVNLHYIPVPIQPYYSRLGHSLGNLPVTKLYYEEAISIPLYHAMLEGAQDEVIDALLDVLG